MNGEQKFWLGFWTLIATVLITVTISITLAAMDTNNKMTNAIKSGFTPTEAACAFDPAENNKLQCAILASKK
jgi:hypothetical protein